MLMCALPVHAVADAPKIVQIGYQKSGFLLLVRSERTLEKRLEPLGYAVEWHEFTSGPPLLEAMNSGAIDFGHSGQPPAVLERSEARTHYHFLLPLTPAVVAEQQGVADTFARLGIIPKPIRVSDDVYNGPVPGL